MDEHITKLNTKIRKKENELNALYNKIQKLETAEMSLTSVLGVIFEN